jgi:alpha-N-acetylglucosaminidase
VWFDAKAWVAHIDWMALQGINVFYALTGQEEVQYKTFLKFGLKDVDIREFFNGPVRPSTDPMRTLFLHCG